MAESIREMTAKFNKLDKFEGNDYRRWQKKMHFMLTTLKVAYVLSTPRPEAVENETLEDSRKRSKWDNDDYICRGHILNGMSDSLFDIHCEAESAKDLWDTLESKYIAEDASSKKFLVSDFNSYKMVDSRSVIEQYNELLRILGQFKLHNMKMHESIAMAESIREMTAKFNKLDKFEGNDYRRWQKKMHFMLTTLKVAYVLSTPRPEAVENETLEDSRKRSKWDNDDYICRGHILNGMSDSLFDIHCEAESAKDLWDTLESKYIAEDASSKKFLVSDFNSYKMVDSRSVIEQYNELLRILGQFKLHNMKMDESIVVSSLIDKLPPMAESIREMTAKFNKLDKFEGNDYRRWQKKMHFMLTTLKVAYVLSTPRPEAVENETLEDSRKRSKWDNDDYICRGHILNGMSDSLFDIHCEAESAKDLWDTLESKYIAEDASSKKFLVSDFNSYKMVDSRSVIEQYNELLRILGQFKLHNMKMDESIAVSSLIDKLPPMAESIREMTAKFNKLDKFEGNDYRRWQKKMHFMLTTLKVAYVLSTPRPEAVENETLEDSRKRSKWDNDDYICRGHILNGMSDSLFDIHCEAESAKDLWDTLESKYIAEDASSKKFLVIDFNSYKMVDSRSVIEQYNELLRILGQFKLHNMKMDESIAVSSLIDKLPPS
ncbi:hypothetical protein OROGR_004917 [Orobanche gracilis]